MRECVYGINFCGGCNPQIDRKRISNKIQALLSSTAFRPEYNNWDAEFIIRLSGCTANCALQYHLSDVPSAVIAGPTFNAVDTPEEDLAGLAAAAVKAFFEGRGSS